VTQTKNRALNAKAQGQTARIPDQAVMVQSLSAKVSV